LAGEAEALPESVVEVKVIVAAARGEDLGQREEGVLVGAGAGCRAGLSCSTSGSNPRTRQGGRRTFLADFGVGDVEA
jgi:hypothetical protein